MLVLLLHSIYLNNTFKTQYLSTGNHNLQIKEVQQILIESLE